MQQQQDNHKTVRRKNSQPAQFRRKGYQYLWTNDKRANDKVTN